MPLLVDGVSIFFSSDVCGFVFCINKKKNILNYEPIKKITQTKNTHSTCFDCFFFTLVIRRLIFFVMIF